MHLFSAAAALVSLSLTVDALHFYIDTSQEKCFLEELPKDTMILGHYKIQQYSQPTSTYEENTSLGLQIAVDDTLSGMRVKDYKASSSGRFSFTSAVSSTYSICFSTNRTGWFSHEKARVDLDLVIGDAASDEELEGGGGMKDKLGELAGRVRDLNHRIADIRREQQYQKEREGEFRDKSESTNSKVVWWTLFQLGMLGVTCVWQVRHLKQFFETKKLV